MIFYMYLPLLVVDGQKWNRRGLFREPLSWTPILGRSVPPNVKSFDHGLNSSLNQWLFNFINQSSTNNGPSSKRAQNVSCNPSKEISDCSSRLQTSKGRKCELQRKVPDSFDLVRERERERVLFGSFLWLSLLLVFSHRSLSSVATTPLNAPHISAPQMAPWLLGIPGSQRSCPSGSQRLVRKPIWRWERCGPGDVIRID